MPGVLDHLRSLCQNQHTAKSADNPEMGGRTQGRIVKFQYKRAVPIAEAVVVIE